MRSVKPHSMPLLVTSLENSIQAHCSPCSHIIYLRYSVSFQVPCSPLLLRLPSNNPLLRSVSGSFSPSFSSRISGWGGGEALRAVAVTDLLPRVPRKPETRLWMAGSQRCGEGRMQRNVKEDGWSGTAGGPQQHTQHPV